MNKSSLRLSIVSECKEVLRPKSLRTAIVEKDGHTDECIKFFVRKEDRMWWKGTQTELRLHLNCPLLGAEQARCFRVHL